MKKILKRVGIAVLLIAVIIAVAICFALYKMSASTGIGSAGGADYDRKIEIWDMPAGYSTDLKLNSMNAKTSGNVIVQQMLFAGAIVGDEYKDSEKTIDTFTYLYEIKGGYESETYEDKPYLIPYLSEDSDTAVIVLPGGGFSFKSMDGSTSEGRDVAVTLKENGINAFVLHYRSNPYEYPIPMLDLQRAVRYLKYHAEEYGINPEKIGLIGFSAGGYEIGYFINRLQGNNLFPEDYVPNEIDVMDDNVVAAAMIYPALSFNSNVPMLFALFDDDDVKNEETRSELLKQTDLKNFVECSRNIPQFIAWGTKDSMVGVTETPAYIETAKNIGVDIKEVVADGQDHGFGQEYYMNEYLMWFKELIGE